MIKLVHAEYVSCKRDILGDIEEIEIRDINTGKHVHVTPAQIVNAVQQKRIEIKYIKVSADGKLHITKKNKLTVGDKIKSLKAEIKNLEMSSLPADKDKAIRKQRLLYELEKEKYKFKKFVGEQKEEK